MGFKLHLTHCEKLSWKPKLIVSLIFFKPGIVSSGYDIQPKISVSICFQAGHEHLLSCEYYVPLVLASVLGNPMLHNNSVLIFNYSNDIWIPFRYPNSHHSICILGSFIDVCTIGGILFKIYIHLYSRCNCRWYNSVLLQMCMLYNIDVNCMLF